MRYHILTLGCQMNKSDSERVRTVIEGMGYRFTDNEDDADLLGVLACSVRQKAIDKVYSRITKWNKQKKNRNLLTFVSGCVLPADREKFLKLFDFVFPMSELPDFPEMIRQYGMVTPLQTVHTPAEKGRIFQPESVEKNSQKKSGQLVLKPEEKIKDFWKLQPAYNSEFEAFIPIQNGCDKFCTYCAVPYTRGREISRPSGEILQELKVLVDKGYKSITLLGQNVNSYGLDKNGEEISFAGLLKEIGEYGRAVKTPFWLYFTSPHPRDMSDEVLHVIAAYDCLAKQIHLPLQSGDDSVLKRMNRKHTLATYKTIISSIRTILPQATIFTDIIVGFSGETDAQFENTRKAFEDIRFNMAYIAVYSPRPGAASAKWEDDIPMAVKKKRLHLLTEELTQHTLQYNSDQIGKKLRVLVIDADRKHGYLSGITEGRIVVRFKAPQWVTPGCFVDLLITSAATYSLEGDLINTSIPEPQSV